MDKFQLAKFMAHGFVASAFIAGCAVSGSAFFLYKHYFDRPKPIASADIKPDVKVASYVYADGRMTAYLTDGQIIHPQSFKKTDSGMQVFFNGQWIGGTGK